MSTGNRHMFGGFEIEQLARLVAARLGVQPAPAVLQEFLAEATLENSATAYLEKLSRPESAAEWSGAPATHLLTHETYFLRNKGHWEALQQSVIPGLLPRLDPSLTPLRIWSAGCASGEEPLSVAMVLLETGQDHRLGSNRIVATDISDISLAQAREGRYSARSLQCMPAHLIDRYLEERKGAWTVRPSVTNLVRYQRLNLADRSAVEDFIANEGPFHIVFCRNVLIYFDAELCRRLLGQFASALHREGTLFLGHAEFPQMWSDDFKPQHTCGTIIWRHRGSAGNTGRERASSAPNRVRATRRPVDASSALDRLLEQTGSSARMGARVCERAPDRASAATSSVATVPIAGLCEVWPEIVDVLQHAKFGRNGEAVSAARRLVEEHQLLPETHYALGLALEASGQSECAAGAYQNAVFLDSEFACAQWRLGLTLAAVGQRERAIAAVRWAVKLMPAELESRIQHLNDLSREELIGMMERTLEWLLKHTN